MNNAEKRERIIQEARKLIGTPFRHMGVTRFGVDCKGFCWLSYYKAGINDIPQGDGRIYEPNWFWFVDKERYLDGILKYFQFTNNPQKADIIIFNCYSSFITHAGIYCGNNNFIHAPSGKKVRFDNLDHRYWKKAFQKAKEISNSSGFLIYKGFIN